MIHITKVFNILRNKHRFNIYKLIMDEPGIGQGEIARKFKRRITQGMLSIILSDMVEVGLIDRAREKTRNSYDIGNKAVEGGVKYFLHMLNK